MPSCQCVRLPRLLLGQPKGPNNAAQPSARPDRLYEKRGRGAASVVKSQQEPRIVVCRKHSSSPSMAQLHSWQAFRKEAKLKSGNAAKYSQQIRSKTIFVREMAILNTKYKSRIRTCRNRSEHAATMVSSAQNNEIST